MGERGEVEQQRGGFGRRVTATACKGNKADKRTAVVGVCGGPGEMKDRSVRANVKAQRNSAGWLPWKDPRNQRSRLQSKIKVTILVCRRGLQGTQQLGQAAFC